eukprot:CAMPEP_0119353962 /NCGR_PEP_ID=MMETSP1334-20130426/3040_1 /TAXON_ID=127549 /ORGANISM="Calcidiscus leptoporus, Strain RCC1130" /LENGTH=510 /DNA_ID=CAMNT_0007367387 /DNA_START=196 /DNA_END=1725 /DNA_ORIENTATION=+
MPTTTTQHDPEHGLAQTAPAKISKPSTFAIRLPRRTTVIAFTVALVIFTVGGAASTLGVAWAAGLFSASGTTMPKMPTGASHELVKLVERFVLEYEKLERGILDPMARAALRDYDMSNKTAVEVVKYVTDRHTTAKLWDMGLKLSVAQRAELLGVPLEVLAPPASLPKGMLEGIVDEEGGVNNASDHHGRSLLTQSVNTWADDGDKVDGMFTKAADRIRSKDNVVKYCFDKWPKGYANGMPEEYQILIRLAVDQMKTQINAAGPGNCLDFEEFHFKSSECDVHINAADTSNSAMFDVKQGNIMIFLNKDGFDKSIIIHEFGHALGMGHEHQRPDRPPPPGTFNFEDYGDNYQIVADYNTRIPFDTTSIMNYNDIGYSMYDPAQHVRNKGGFSMYDVEQLRRIYDCPVSPFHVKYTDRWPHCANIKCTTTTRTKMESMCASDAECNGFSWPANLLSNPSASGFGCLKKSCLKDGSAGVGFGSHGYFEEKSLALVQHRAQIKATHGLCLDAS